MIIQRFYLTYLAPALLWLVSMTLAVQAAPLSYTLDDAILISQPRMGGWHRFDILTVGLDRCSCDCGHI